MERAMSIEEKIRRAEEIYNRRNGNNYYTTYKSNQIEKKTSSLSRKLVKQIFICLLIYAVFYVTTNREYFLSKEFRNKAEEFTSQSESLSNIYNYIMGYVDKFFNINEENSKDTEETHPTENSDSQM